jgi:alpha-glucosidase
MSGHTDKGRDGCRVPLPWTSEGYDYGFSPEGGQAPWLPQPAEWAELAADAQAGVPGSTLALYRDALALRRQLPELGDGTLTWLDAPAQVLAYSRPGGGGGAEFQSWTNFGSEPVALPAGEVLISSGELVDGQLPSDTTVWLKA